MIAIRSNPDHVLSSVGRNFFMKCILHFVSYDIVNVIWAPGKEYRHVEFLHHSLHRAGPFQPFSFGAFGEEVVVFSFLQSMSSRRRENTPTAYKSPPWWCVVDQWAPLTPIPLPDNWEAALRSVGHQSTCAEPPPLMLCGVRNRVNPSDHLRQTPLLPLAIRWLLRHFLPLYLFAACPFNCELLPF